MRIVACGIALFNGLLAASLRSNAVLAVASPFLTQREVGNLRAFLHRLPALHIQLPVEYYSPEGIRALELFRPIKQQAKDFSALLKRACTPHLSPSAVIALVFEVLVCGTMLEGYFRTQRNGAYVLKDSVTTKGSAKYAALRWNALEEVQIVMDYFAYGSTTFSRMEDVAVFQLATLHFQILELIMPPQPFTQKLYFLSKKQSDHLPDLRDWWPLMDRKPTTNALEVIARSREFRLMKKHFGGEVQDDFCLQRFYYTTQMQFTEALWKLDHQDDPRYDQIRRMVSQELQRHRLPPFTSISSNVLDYLDCIKALDESFKRVLALPAFFRLFLTPEQYEKLASMFLRDSLLAIERMVFPKYQNPQELLLTLQITKEMKMSKGEYEVVKEWHQHVLSGQLLFQDAPQSPTHSLYAFAMQLVVLLEVSLHDESYRDCVSVAWLESTVKSGLFIVEELKGRVRDPVMRMRIQVMLQAVKLLVAQRRQMSHFFSSVLGKMNSLFAINSSS